MPEIKKVLIANRGEIAIRILRTLRKMGIKSVAVHSKIDEEAMHVGFADESVCIGPADSKESYLNMKNIIAAAELTGSQAIHPGYGFLSENPDFVDMVEEHDLIFIGPKGNQIRQLGDKVQAKILMKEAGIKTIPGTEETMEDPKEAIKIAQEIGLPILFKSPSCGGGRGQRIVYKKEELEQKFTEAQQEAIAISNNSGIYIEKYFDSPKHYEFQIIGDGKGKILVFPERDCSIQRKHQKVWEEAPSDISNEQRMMISEKIAKVLSKTKYRNAGTVEFLYKDGEFYFIEMNTRIQVEHPITEEITFFDLIELQIKVAMEEKLPNQDEIKIRGHSIESRITAEDPFDFTPSPGKITEYLAPSGPDVRIDGALYPGWKIPPHYDSLAAKVISYGKTREECLATHKQALREMVISGIKTSIQLHSWLVEQEEIKNRTAGTQWLEEALKKRKKSDD